MRIVNKRHLVKRIVRIAIVVFLLLFVFAYIFPIIWMVIGSFKTDADVNAMPPKIIFEPTITNYKEVLIDNQLIFFLRNSVIIVLFSSILAVAVGTLAAYALSRFSFKGNRDLAFFILSTRIAPPVMVVIPIFIMFNTFQLYNTFVGMILVYTAMNLPLSVWLLRSFFLDIPRELDEAAEIDGCGKMTAFFRVILPLTMPGLAATLILSMIFAWNEFLFALILTARNTRTLPVTVTTFISGMGIQWGQLNAAGTMIMFPLLIFAFVMQKRLLTGLTMGAVKG